MSSSIPSTYQYTSPLRPLDIGYAARMGDVEIDWENTDIGAMYPEQMATRRYAFKSPLPDTVVDALELKRA